MRNRRDIGGTVQARPDLAGPQRLFGQPHHQPYRADAAIPVVGEFEVPIGAIAPAQFYAPMARRHMELFGLTSRQLAEIAVTMRRHALLNDNAVMKSR